MKSYLACVLLLACLAVPALQAPVADPATQLQTLENRATALLDRVTKVTTMFRGQYPHMLRQLDYQINLVQALEARIKQAITNTGLQSHQVNVLEEELLHLENRVEEEIDILRQVGHDFKPTGQSVTEIIVHAQQVITQGKTAQAKIAAGSPEARDIDQNIKVIELIIQSLQTGPAKSATDLSNFEQELAIHELSLKKLLEKVSTQNP